MATFVVGGGGFQGGTAVRRPVTNTVQAPAINPQVVGANQVLVGPAAAPGDTSVGGGGGGGLTPVAAPVAGPVRPSAVQVDPLLASLGALDTVLGNKNQQTYDEYGRAIAGYDAQDKIDSDAYNQNVQQNEGTYTSNNQRALLNAANAGSGLRGVLASLGGLAGSGGDLVRRLVGLAANSDTGEARDTFDVNAGNLNSAWSSAEQQQRQRRGDAVATRDNNLMNNEAGVLSSKQSIYQQLANLYGTDFAEGGQYAAQASALSPRIAATTRASVAPYAPPSASFSPAALKSYLAGTQNLEVSTAGGGGEAGTLPVNSPLFRPKREDRLAGVA